MRQLSPTLEPFEELAAKAAQTSLRGLARLVAREILNIPDEPVDPDLREHAPCRKHPTKRTDSLGCRQTSLQRVSRRKREEF
jgi:hypothetical protein